LLVNQMVQSSLQRAGLDELTQDDNEKIEEY